MTSGELEYGDNAFSARVKDLQQSIAEERVLLAKIKVKRRLLSQTVHYDLLKAMEQDVSKRLTKLEQELRQVKLTDGHTTNQ